jgi:hypothetical protein
MAILTAFMPPDSAMHHSPVSQTLLYVMLPRLDDQDAGNGQIQLDAKPEHALAGALQNTHIVDLA